MEPIRIVLADDHPLVREGTRRILEQCPDLKVVGEADDGQQALELVESLKPDVALLDIRLPKINGIGVARRIKGCSPNTKALMLTAYDDDDYILALMEVGVWGYLLKTAKTDELIESVRRVHLGEPFLDQAITAKVAHLWAHHQISDRDEVSRQLSPREREVLEIAAKGLPNKQIAAQLSISVRTVEGHFSNILEKLNVSSRMEAVLYAISRHLVSLEEEKWR